MMTITTRQFSIREYDTYYYFWTKGDAEFKLSKKFLSDIYNATEYIVVNGVAEKNTIPLDPKAYIVKNLLKKDPTLNKKSVTSLVGKFLKAVELRDGFERRKSKLVTKWTNI